MSDDDCAVISDGEDDKARDNDVVTLDDSIEEKSAPEAELLESKEAAAASGESRDGVVAMDDPETTTTTTAATITKNSASPRNRDCDDVIMLDDDDGITPTSSEVMMTTPTMSVTPKGSTTSVGRAVDDDDDDVVMVSTVEKEVVKAKIEEQSEGSATASKPREIPDSEAGGMDETTEDVARQVLDNVVRLVEAGRTPGSSSVSSNVGGAAASASNLPPPTSGVGEDDDDDDGKWLLGGPRGSDETTEPGELCLDVSETDIVFKDPPPPDAVKNEKPDGVKDEKPNGVKDETPNDVAGKPPPPLSDDVNGEKPYNDFKKGVSASDVKNEDGAKAEADNEARERDVRPKEFPVNDQFKIPANKAQEQKPTETLMNVNDASKESFAGAPSDGVGTSASSSAAPSVLSREEMNEMFNIFLNDNIPGDADFEIPLNFDEIVEESFDRLSQEVEDKVAGIVKRIINMEEEQAVIKQTMERRQMRIDRLVKTLGVSFESKAVGDVIVLDDADSDTSATSKTSSGADSGASAVKAQESRSEEDLVITGSKPGTTVYGFRPGQCLPQKKIPEVRVGSKIFAKKSNDIWYRGVVTEILQEALTPKHREFKIKFDGKGTKTVGALHLAPIPSNPAELDFIVGSRVIALYEEEQSSPQQVQRSWFAGIIAEPPCTRNKNRYLVFFDDGYAQYTDPKKVLNVYYQSPQIWEDIHKDSRPFMKSYLQQYPERPMVRLSQGNIVKTEWRGKWWSARVDEVDGSLVKMFFEADGRVEWIYRGSTRLEPLYKELANTRRLATATTTSTMRRHNLGSRNANMPFVEYTRDFNDVQATQPLNNESAQQGTLGPSASSRAEIKKKGNVAKKSTSSATQSKSPSVERFPSVSTSHASSFQPSGDYHSRPVTYSAASGGTHQQVAAAANQLQQRQQTPDHAASPAGGAAAAQWSRKKFAAHKCGLRCLGEGNANDDPQQHKGCNPLLIPIYCGWERQVSKPSLANVKKHVNYRAPCAKRMRTLNEVQNYLVLTDSRLTIDLFCFDPNVHTQFEFIPARTFCDIKDLSYGNEPVPVSCVNGLDGLYPDYVEYSTKRHPGEDVKLILDSDFLVCCDCTDMCQDSSKCACRRLTIEATGALDREAKFDETAGYKHRRLSEPLTTGVYECNPKCHCDHRCTNRVAQRGLSVRLQVFKTERRGWGMRCLDDLPKGCFICVYTGLLLSEDGANEDGFNQGDEYLAELDHIEVVEKQKDEMKPDDEGVLTDSDAEDEQDDDKAFKPLHQPSVASSDKRQTRGRSRGATDDEIVLEGDSDGEEEKKKQGSRFKNLPNPNAAAIRRRREARRSLRDYFEDSNNIYVVNAKKKGNLGRYLNHCCDPNLFVQNVFTDTQDLRFPWVAFFSMKHIRAGSELTWDYNYEVGSVPGKVLYCYCGATNCRGRLL